MFILNPDPYLLPSYRISPFQTSDIATNTKLPESNIIDDYFVERFGEVKFQYVTTGRSAIHKALSYYNLKSDDVVSIVTTSQNFYISGCVTDEIEKFCKWDRKITDKTKVIFVNHEFGYPYKNLNELKKYGLPIIEDAAHSFFSEDPENSIGSVGDFMIYSFPKMFPLQIGGLLVSNVETAFETDLEPEALQYIKNVLSFYIDKTDTITSKRLENYRFLKETFTELGFTETFPLSEGIIPGVFMFDINNEDIDLPAMKTYLWKHGIQCSVFYGRRAFFIPVHQALVKEDLLYFREVIRSFLSLQH